MNVLELKKITLAQSLVKMQFENKIQSENDIIQIAREVMTDLGMSYKQALRFIESVFTSIDIVQNHLLNENP